MRRGSGELPCPAATCSGTSSPTRSGSEAIHCRYAGSLGVAWVVVDRVESGAVQAVRAAVEAMSAGAGAGAVYVDLPLDEAEKKNPFRGVAPFSLCHAMSELLTLGVPLNEVIKMVTCNAAVMVGMEDEIGSIRPGKRADFTVLDADPYRVPPAAIREIGIWGTVLDGRPHPIRGPSGAPTPDRGDR